MNRRKATLIYFKSWFFIDLLSSIPYDWIADGTIDYQEHVSKAEIIQLARILKIAKFLRILKLLRVFKLKTLMYKYEDFFFNESVVVILGLSKILVIIFVIAHWMACLFSAVSKA